MPLPGTFTASYTSHAAINAQRYNLSPVKITRQRWLEELREGGRKGGTEARRGQQGNEWGAGSGRAGRKKDGNALIFLDIQFLSRYLQPWNEKINIPCVYKFEYEENSIYIVIKERPNCARSLVYWAELSRSRETHKPLYPAISPSLPASSSTCTALASSCTLTPKSSCAGRQRSFVIPRWWWSRNSGKPPKDDCSVNVNRTCNSYVVIICQPCKAQI